MVLVDDDDSLVGKKKKQERSKERKIERKPSLCMLSHDEKDMLNQ